MQFEAKEAPRKITLNHYALSAVMVELSQPALEARYLSSVRLDLS